MKDKRESNEEIVKKYLRTLTKEQILEIHVRNLSDARINKIANDIDKECK